MLSASHDVFELDSGLRRNDAEEWVKFLASLALHPNPLPGGARESQHRGCCLQPSARRPRTRFASITVYLAPFGRHPFRVQPHMIETNPILAQIADLKARIESLRGYL
ncbi:hypothetical protein GCM10007901_25200 [Dyella acidisoli]|uniref:Uncharacterized protein n=1 Tax=Dyella acidisoli TaxID=1867834 RepID=A0ABQ5XPE6_9GAMM|nr:hypothetical protein GCM10007901_25200 [Dyella acidisoli]